MSENSIWNLLDELSNKKGITEIAINAKDKIFVEREGEFIQLDFKVNEKDFIPFIKDVAKKNNKVIDESRLIFDGVLPDNGRVNVIGSPFVRGTPAISIRKYLKDIVSFDKDPGLFGLNASWITFLKAAVRSKLSIVICGGTGAGKTTFLNLLLNEVSPSDRVISIEDTRELTLRIPNKIHLEARSEDERYNMGTLVKNTLRMKPDRLVIGEVRGGELFDLLMAMNTGHKGSMTSIHANSTRECLGRMETLFLLSGHESPYKLVRNQIAGGVDLIIHLSNDRVRGKVVGEITEVTGMEGDQILLQTLAKYTDGRLKFQGIPSSFTEVLNREAELELDFFDMHF